MNLKKCQPVLFVKDAGGSTKFYTEVLGFTVIMDNGGANITFKEGFTVWQIWEGNIISQTIGLENITNNNNISRFELCFETDELDNIYKTLKDNNVQFLHEINTELWGQRTIRFYDPDGHLIEVGEEMSIFLKRIYEEEGRDLEATAKRTFMPIDALKHFVLEKKSIEETIIGLERAALERWNNGDPSGYLELSTSDVTYFDPFLEKRIDGLDALTALYESIRGQIHVDGYELIDPKVQSTDNVAVLTFNYVANSGDLVFRWNCTEVYRLEPNEGWKIMQTHWSQMPK